MVMLSGTVLFIRSTSCLLDFPRKINLYSAMAFSAIFTFSPNLGGKINLPRPLPLQQHLSVFEVDYKIDLTNHAMFLA